MDHAAPNDENNNMNKTEPSVEAPKSSNNALPALSITNTGGYRIGGLHKDERSGFVSTQAHSLAPKDQECGRRVSTDSESRAPFLVQAKPLNDSGLSGKDIRTVSGRGLRSVRVPTASDGGGRSDYLRVFVRVRPWLPSENHGKGDDAVTIQ